ncbi:MAG TPA: SDR family NAD(P)-dependent oxidoreductase, partial [Solirubrobacter sp.]|nr:SDR family NAD(P)-dependent oxidoreductase [Solirubrobacter sp.]
MAAVTGGGGGIGRAICERLAAEGARVAALDLDAGGAPAGALALEVDVTDSAGFDAALARVEAELGPLDILVNNAGAVGGAHLKRVTPLLAVQREERLAGQVRTPLDALVRLSDEEWSQLLRVHLD